MINNTCIRDMCNSEICVKTFAVQGRRIRYHGQFCALHAESFWREYNSAVLVGPKECFGTSRTEYDIELLVIDYRIDYPCWISLRECGGKRQFSLKTGVFEVAALQRELEKAHADRPLAHNLIISVAKAYGGAFETLTIDCSTGSSIYFAQLQLANNGTLIDCRPSDGIILAVMSSIPIWLSTSLQQQIEPDH